MSLTVVIPILWTSWSTMLVTPFKFGTAHLQALDLPPLRNLNRISVPAWPHSCLVALTQTYWLSDRLFSKSEKTCLFMEVCSQNMLPTVSTRLTVRHKHGSEENPIFPQCCRVRVVLSGPDCTLMILILRRAQFSKRH